MKTTKFRKIVSALMASTLVLSSAGTVLVSADVGYFAETNKGKYELVYKNDCENIFTAHDYTWFGGDYGLTKKQSDDVYDGTYGIRASVQNDQTHWGRGFADVKMYKPRDDNRDYNVSVPLTKGETYVMSWKSKKETASVGFNSMMFDPNDQAYASAESNKELLLANDGWKPHSFVFEANDGYRNHVPIIMYNKGGGETGGTILVDDVMVYHVIDKSVLNETASVAITSLNTTTMTVAYTGNVDLDDVKNTHTYEVGGEYAKSVSYDEKTKVATVTLGKELSSDKTKVIISATDFIGRPLYIYDAEYTVTLPEVASYTTVMDGVTEIDPSNEIVLNFSAVMDEKTVTNKANYIFGAGETGNEISKIEKVSDKEYKIVFKEPLKRVKDFSYTLKISGLKDAYGRDLAEGYTEKTFTFGIKLVAPKLLSATPASGTADIQAGDKEVSLTFNKNIDPTTVSGITVDNDATVSAPAVNDNVVTFTLGGLQAAKTYTVTISGVKDVEGETVTDTTLTYYTALEMIDVYSNAFENAAATGDLKGDTDWRRFSLNGTNSFDKTEYISAPSSVMSIIKSRDNADMTIGNSKDTSYRVSIQVGKKYRFSFCVKIPDDSNISSYSIVNGDNKTFIGGATSEDIGNGWKKVTVDFIASSQNDSDKKSGKMNSPSVRFNASTNENLKVYLDDVKLQQFPDVEISSGNVEDNQEGVSLNDTIDMTFNGGLTSATATVGGVNCTVNKNGNKVEIDVSSAGLEGGKWYELELKVKDNNGVETTHKKTFKTQNSVEVGEGVKVGGVEYTKDMTVSKSSDMSISLPVNVNAVKPIYVVAVVYDANGYMVGAKCEKVTFSKAGSADKTFTLESAKLADGSYVKVFVWDGLNTRGILSNPMSFKVQ